MTEFFDHVDGARSWLADACRKGVSAERAALCVGMAQAEATLALVEQQRIANLISLADRHRDPQAADALWEDDTLSGGLRPEISAALGIETKEETNDVSSV